MYELPHFACQRLCRQREILQQSLLADYATNYNSLGGVWVVWGIQRKKPCTPYCFKVPKLRSTLVVLATLVQIYVLFIKEELFFFFQVKKSEVDTEELRKKNEEIASKFSSCPHQYYTFEVSHEMIRMPFPCCFDFNSLSCIFPTGFNLSLQSILEGSKDKLLKKVRSTKQ